MTLGFLGENGFMDETDKCYINNWMKEWNKKEEKKKETEHNLAFGFRIFCVDEC